MPDAYTTENLYAGAAAWVFAILRPENRSLAFVYHSRLVANGEYNRDEAWDIVRRMYNRGEGQFNIH